MATPLITTKLYIPPPRFNLVTRPRLIQRLDEGLRRRHKLTLISAPAGFGKTTLLSEWSSRLGAGAQDASTGRPPRSAGGYRVAWVSLDEGDNDPGRFLAYLVASLQTIQADIGQTDSDALQSPTPPSIEGLMASLINQIGAVTHDIALILDDYHLITSEPLHDALTFLIDHLPPNLHLVIATRADPPLPIPRLRGRGELTEVRQPDLRFTSGEAEALLKGVMDLELSANDVVALASRTEGWAAGLQMAAASMRDREDIGGFVRAFTGSDRFILDYLTEEVLQRQDTSIQAFLLQTAVLDRLTGPLCDAILEGGESADQPASQEILEYLERNNLFVVPLDSERRWYRYHRLFVDLLRARLGQTQPDWIPSLHRRASEWYERNGLVSAAIEHALSAEDFGRAANLMERAADATLMRGELATFLRWVDAIPHDVLCSHPSLLTSHAWMLLLSGSPLEAIESRLQDIDREGEPATGRIVALRALLAAFKGQLSHAVQLSRQALTQLPAEDLFARDLVAWISGAIQLASDDDAVGARAMEEVLGVKPEIRESDGHRYGDVYKAELLVRQGQLRRAAATYRQVVELAIDAQGRQLPIAGQALVGLGDLSREWNDLQAATRYLEEGIHLSERWTEVGPLEAYIGLARVRQAQGEVDAAQEAIQKAQELAAKFDVTDIDDLSVALFRARLWIAQGDLTAARDWAERRELYRYIDSPLQEEREASVEYRLRKYELLILARLLIAEGQLSGTITLLESLLPIAMQRGRPGLVIEIHVLQALTFQAQGDTDQAIHALEHAISLAEPEGYVRVFVDEGEPLARLLEKARAQRITTDYPDRLLSAFASETLDPERTTRSSCPDIVSSASSTPTLVEPLSERELEVLQLLSTHLSSTEIAEKLFISVNTVRFHIKSIYAKLDVHRRAEAVERATELKLL